MTRTDHPGIRSHLDTESAERVAGELLDAAVRAAEAAGAPVSNRQLAEAMGMSASGEKAVREMRAGLRPLTLPKLVQLLLHRPTVGRALLAELAAWSARAHGVPADDALPALDAVVLASLALAGEAHSASSDRAVAADERTRVVAAGGGVRRALERFEAATSPAVRAVAR